SRTSAGRGREVGRASALGGGWAVRDVFGCLGRHGHGARRDRQNIRHGDRAADRRVDGVRVAAGFDAGSVRALAEQGGGGRDVEEDGERVGVFSPTEQARPGEDDASALFFSRRTRARYRAPKAVRREWATGIEPPTSSLGS